MLQPAAAGPVASHLVSTSPASPARRRSVDRPAAPGAAVLPVALGALAALASVAILLFEIATWDRIAPGVSVLGLQVGGLTRGEAAAQLAPRVEALLARPLALRYGDRSWDTTARDLGVRLDPANLAEAAYKVGREGNPFARLTEQLGALAAGRTLAVSSTTDQAALDASLTRVARDLDRAPQDARLGLARDGTVQYTPGLNGLSVDVPATRERVAQALNGSGAVVEIVVREQPPALADDLVRPAREQLARILGDGGAAPLTLTFGRQQWPLERAEVTALLSVTGGTRPGQPAGVEIDEQPLRALAARLAKELDQTVQDARFDFNGGNLKVLRASKEGRELDQAATVALIKEKLLAGERTADLPVAIVKPAVSSENPNALGIVERIGGASTSFAGSIPEKKWNIKLAAERLNGVVVPPGGTFSFNKEVGPTTLAAGFKWGFGIAASDQGVQTVPSVAGGICQVSTTLFQPVFFAGYPLEERYWHMYWIPAYTARDGIVGLDATVDEAAGLDLKWVNSTENYVLIQAATDDERVYFGLYGKKPSWTVELSQEISNRRPPDPQPVAQEEPSLPWGRTLQVESAREGFDVVVTRRVTGPDGQEVRPPLRLRSSYQPSRTVTLVGTANKPANASVDEAIAKVLGPQKVEENKPVGDPAQRPEPATGAATPTPAGTPAARPTAPPAQATPAAGANATPTPAPTRAP